MDLIPKEIIEQRIYLIRRQKVMLSYDLAELYQVNTSAFMQAVKRNIRRFPADFMFPLTRKEILNLSQIVTNPDFSCSVTLNIKSSGKRTTGLFVMLYDLAHCFNSPAQSYGESPR